MAGSVPSTRAGGSPRRPLLGLLAEIVGLTGAALGILMIVSLWLVQGSITDSIGDGVDAIRAEVERPAAKAGQAGERLEARAVEVDEVAADARALAETADPPAAAVAAVADDLSEVSDRYAEARVWYVDIRDQAQGVLDVLDWIDSLLPSIELPDGPRELLLEIDEGVQELDTAVAVLSQAGSAELVLAETAGSIAETAERISIGLREAADVARLTDDALVGVSDTLAQAADELSSLLRLAVVVSSLVLLYLVLLHLALWALGRRWRAPGPEA